MTTPSLVWLSRARVAIGVIFLVRTTPTVSLLPGLYRHLGSPMYGWPEETGFSAAVFGLVLPPLAVKALVLVRTVGAILFTIGFFGRLGGLFAVIAGYAVYAQDPFGLIFTLHALYLGVLLLSVGDAFTANALRPIPARSPSSSVWLVRSFVVSVYVWSAIAKLAHGFASGRVLALERARHMIEGPFAAWLDRPGVPRLMGVAIVVAEFGLGPLLLVRRTRALGVFLACIFHAVLEITARPDVFSWVMVALLLSFVGDDDHLVGGARPQESPKQSRPKDAAQS